MFEYTLDRFEKFDIHKDITHKSLKGLIFQPKTINRIIRTNSFNRVFDAYGAYKYYLLRRMINVSSWYKGDMFEFYEPLIHPYRSKLLFVINKQNGRLDNIISKSIFDDISKRMEKDLSVYAICDHAVKRAIERVEDVANLSPMEAYEWLEREIIHWNLCVIKPKYKVMALLNHNFESCNYYMDKEDRVYVVKDHLLMTIHCNEADRWTRK